MKKKLLIVLLSLAVVVGLGLPVQAATDELTVIINGETQSYTQPPVIIKGSTLVPLRGIFETLGATVSWNGETKTVTATSGNTKISLVIGSVDTTVNGKDVKISVPAQIINKSTMVPLRFVSEALGASVGWDGETRTITINYSPKAEEKTTTSEVANEGQEFYYKETSDGVKTKITKKEFDSIIEASIKYLDDENHMNLPLSKELEVLKEYQFTLLTKAADDKYGVFAIVLGEGLENELGSKTQFIAYLGGKGLLDGETIDFDLTYSVYPILTDKVEANVYYKFINNIPTPLSELEEIMSEDN